MINEKIPATRRRVRHAKPAAAPTKKPSKTETRVPEGESALGYLPTSDSIQPDIDASDVVY